MTNDSHISRQNIISDANEAHQFLSKFDQKYPNFLTPEIQLLFKENIHSLYEKNSNVILEIMPAIAMLAMAAWLFLYMGFLKNVSFFSIFMFIFFVLILGRPLFDALLFFRGRNQLRKILRQASIDPHDLETLCLAYIAITDKETKRFAWGGDSGVGGRGGSGAGGCGGFGGGGGCGGGGG